MPLLTAVPGKGNDQVRLDVSLQVLNPKLQIIALYGNGK